MNYTRQKLVHQANDQIDCLTE